jgi:hypothetical protein
MNTVDSTLKVLKNIYEEQIRYKPYKNVDTVINENLKILNLVK